MNNKAKVTQAKNTCETIIKLLDKSIKELSKANKWGFFDLAGGKGFTSIVKRNKMSSYRKIGKKIEKESKKLQNELNSLDIAMPSIPATKSGSFVGKILDIFADNTAVDAIVQKNIIDAKKELEVYRKELKDVQKQLKKL